MDTLNDTVNLDQDYSSLQTYHIRNAILIRYLCLSLLGFIGMLITLIIGLWRWWSIMTHFGPAVLWRSLQPFLWITIGFVLLGGIGLSLLRHSKQQEIQLSPMGITWRKGRKLRIYHWEKIKNIFITSFRYGIMEFTWASKTEVILYLQEEKRFKISQSFESIGMLVDTIKHYVYPIMFDRVRVAFNQGQPMHFGPITLTSQGVLNGKKNLRWEDIGKIELHRGRLSLQAMDLASGAKISVPAHKIPDIDLCLQILHHFGP